MPEIPLYISTQGPRAAIFHAPQSQDSGLGDVISQSKGLAYLQKKQDERDDLWSLKALGQFKSRWAKELQDRNDKATSSDNFTPLTMEAYDADTDTTVDTAPSDRSRMFLAEQMAQFRAHVYNDALRFETAKVVGEKVKSIHDIHTEAANMVMTDPSLGGEAYSLVQTATRSSGLPSQMLPELEKMGREQFGHSLVVGLGKSPKYGPSQTLTRLRNGEFDDMLSASSRRVLDNELEEDIRSAAARAKHDRNEERVNWAYSFEDYKAAVSKGYIPTAGEADRYSDESVDYMLGDNPEAAAAAKKEMSAAYDVGTIMGDKSLTLQQKELHFANIRAKHTADPTAFREVEGRLNMGEAAVAHEKAALAEDPGGWAQTKPEVLETLNAIRELEGLRDAEQNPEKKAKIDAEVNAMYDGWLQRTYDMQFGNGSPTKKAPKAFVQEQVFRLQEAKPSEIPQIVGDMQAKFGRNFPALFGQVQKAMGGGGLTGVLATAPNTPTTKLIADTYKMTIPELLQGVAPDNVEALKELWQGDRTMREWAKAFGEHKVEGAAELVKSYRAGTYRAAVMYMKRDGVSARDAWTRSLADLTSEYSMVYENNVPYRIPLKAAGTADGQLRMETGAYVVRTAFTPPDNLLVPWGGRATTAADLKTYKDVVRREGYFVTAGDDSGLLLYAGGAPVQFIRGDGLPETVRFTWAQLNKSGGGEAARRRATKKLIEGGLGAAGIGGGP